MLIISWCTVSCARINLLHGSCGRCQYIQCIAYKSTWVAPCFIWYITWWWLARLFVSYKCIAGHVGLMLTQFFRHVTTATSIVLYWHSSVCRHAVTMLSEFKRTCTACAYREWDRTTRRMGFTFDIQRSLFWWVCLVPSGYNPEIFIPFNSD